MKKVVVIGPESTGKSTLCEQLAEHYNTLWCPEFAREYLLLHGTSYSFDDLLTIAKGQIELEEKYTRSMVNSQSSLVNGHSSWRGPFSPELAAHSSQLTAHSFPLLFIDTDMYVMKVWCEYVFGKCHQFILDAIAERKYDLYLLCNIDLPWTYDSLREYPGEAPRKELYNIYKYILLNQETSWAEIGGQNEERLQKAIDAVELYCKNE